VILDVGCGKGNTVKTLLLLNRTVFTASYKIGLDIFLPYLFSAKKIYDDVLRCDIRYLPIKDSSCDIVIANQVIEHLDKNDGFKLMQSLERVSREIILITTPVGYNPKQDLEDNNPWQVHKSTWHPDDFKKHGYKVNGYSGACFLLSERGRYKIKSVSPFLFVLSLITQFITRKLVIASYQMLCIKQKLE
jgi:SAM-dependent methyltransferase